MSIPFKPLQDRIVLKPIQPPDKTPGGIFLPEDSREKPFEAEVISSGPGAFQNGTFVANTLQPGDIVYYGKYHGQEIKFGGELYVVVRECEILGIIRKAARAAGMTDPDRRTVGV